MVKGQAASNTSLVQNNITVPNDSAMQSLVPRVVTWGYLEKLKGYQCTLFRKRITKLWERGLALRKAL